MVTSVENKVGVGVGHLVECLFVGSKNEMSF